MSVRAPYDTRKHPVRIGKTATRGVGCSIHLEESEMPQHKLTERELELIRVLSNKIFDIIGDYLELADDRRNDLADAAVNGMRKFLQEGK